MARMYYERVFRVLEEKGVRYAVAGGVALVLHGVVRFTADLDLLVDLDRKNLERFLLVMQELGYRPRNPVHAADLLDPAKRQEWKREKSMQVFSFVDPAQPMSLIDVFLEEPMPFPEISAAIVRMTAKGTTIPVVSVEHLKRLKRLAARPQDLADIEALESLEQEQP
jgi:hypothetical protein